MKAFFSRIWAGWKKVAHALGVFNTYLLLSLVYFFFFPLFTVLRLGDPLARKLGAESYWRERKLAPDTPDRHRHLF